MGRGTRTCLETPRPPPRSLHRNNWSLPWLLALSSSPPCSRPAFSLRPAPIYRQCRQQYRSPPHSRKDPEVEEAEVVEVAVVEVAAFSYPRHRRSPAPSISATRSASTRSEPV